MMRRLFALYAVAVASVAARADSGIHIDTGTIRNGAAPGIVLKHNHQYEITTDVEIDASGNPGMSALRVPAGVAAIIRIAEGRTLRVIGGPGMGRLPGGAGIEVPVGAKLVVCGEGRLVAVGGDAADGGMGYGGRPGERGCYASPSALKDEMLPCARADIPAPDTREGVFSESFCSTALAYGRGGSGGYGGAGGGGAGAGIGGRGGAGGPGGAGGLGRLVVSDWQYRRRSADYAACVKYFGIDTPYVYGGGAIGCDGEPGRPGEPGGNGRACGEIILAERVHVDVRSGNRAGGGACGPYGATFRTYDSDSNPEGTAFTAFSHTSTLCGILGLGLSTVPVAAGVLGVASSVIALTELFTDAAGVTDRDRLKEMLWYCGGGGGAGGAGGMSAPYGAGPGGAGGGGGGGGGAGFFQVGAGSVYAVGLIAKPDLSVPPLQLSGHGGFGGSAAVGGADGTDADPASGGEVKHTDRADTGKVPYNCSNGRIGAWSWQRSGNNWFWSGRGAAGGAGGTVASNDVRILRSKDVTIIGGCIPESICKSFDGALSHAVTFKDGNDTVATDRFVCGTIIDIAPVSAMTKTIDGKLFYFSGYYTQANGGGVMYFDRFCCPAGMPSITSDLTLYAHWTADNPDCGIAAVDEVRSLSPGQVLAGEKIYVFKDDLAVSNESGSGVVLSEGRTVFYITKGVKVSFTGCNGDADGRPGHPGIEVPANATLIIVGEGELSATGGDGAAGGKGTGGTPIDAKTSGSSSGKYLSVGDGGMGGVGGAGGAPGIGGKGGIGGAIGGAGGYQPMKKRHYWDDYEYDDFDLAGVVGGAGESGNAGSDMGRVYLLGVSVTAVSGRAGDSGAAGDDGGEKAYGNVTFDMIANSYAAGSGSGGGGGGGGGTSAFGIGGGGGAGGGGGGGGSGCYYFEQHDVGKYSGFNPNGLGGNGGEGGSAGGTRGAAGRANGANPKGGAAGAAGAAGAQGGGGEFYASIGTPVEMSHLESDARLPELVYGHSALQRTLTFSRDGREVGKVAAQIGMPLPVLPTNCTCGVRGYVFAGAYVQSGEDKVWWYGLNGEPLRNFEGTSDVALTAVFEPDALSMAEIPQGYGFTYDGSNHVAFVASENPGCRFVSGTTNAIAAGRYTYDVRLADGYTIWSDLRTDDVRTVEWMVSKAAITNEWKDNIYVYDWTKSAEENIPSLGFDLPEGVTVEFTQTRRVLENLFACEAHIVGGANYLDRTMYGAYAYPEILRLSLTPHYPWDTGVEVEYGTTSYSGDKSEKEAFVRNYGTNELVVSVLVRGGETTADERFVDIGLGRTVEWLLDESGQRTEHRVIDLRDVKGLLDSPRLAKLPLYLSIGGRRFVAGTVPVDLTPVPVEANDGIWPHYTVHDYRDIYPVSCSWRFVDDEKDRVQSQLVHLLLGVGVNGEPGEKFTPHTSSQEITDKSVDWIPQRPGTYLLEHEVHFNGVRTGYRRAYFDFCGENPGEDPVLPAETNVVVTVCRRTTGETVGYSSLKAAVADLRYGDELTILGDVQMEVEKVPSGSRVVVGEKGVFRVPVASDIRRDYHKVVTSIVSGRVAYDYVLDDEKVRPAFASDVTGLIYDETGRITGFRLQVSNVKPDLYYEFSRSDDLRGWSLVQKVSADGSEGTAVFEAPASGDVGFYRVAVTDNPSPVFRTASNGDGTVKITGADDIASGAFAGKLVIPPEIGGLRVTRIADGAFRGRLDLTSVDLPMGVAEIGDGAFSGCANLASVKLPAGLVRIGNEAFRNCAALTELEIPQGVMTVGTYFIAGTGLKRLTLPSSVTRVASFDTAPGASLALERVRFMGDKPELDTIPLNLPPDCTVFVQHDKYSWGDVPRIWEGSRVEHWVDFTIRENADGTLTITGIGEIGGNTLVIPATIDGRRVTAVGDALISEEQPHITGLVLSDGLERIGDLAFAGLPAVRAVEFPASLAFLGAAPFGANRAVSAVEELAFDGDAPAIGGDLYLDPARCSIRVRRGSSGWGDVPGTWQDCPVGYGYGGFTASENADGTLTITGAAGEKVVDGVLTVPAQIDGMPVKAIGRNAFFGRSDIRRVVVGEGVETIEPGAFYAAYDMRSVTLPASLKTIGDDAFRDCHMTSFYFEGDCPSVTGTMGVGDPALKCKVFVKRGASGWPTEGESWQGCPVAYFD